MRRFTARLGVNCVAACIACGMAHAAPENAKLLPPPMAEVLIEYPFDDAGWKEAFEAIARSLVAVDETLVAPEPALGRRPFVVRRSTDGMPRMAVGDRDYVVIVCPENRWYAQFAYQMGHELGHAWIGPHSSSWFKESTVTSLAFIALDELAKQWEDCPAASTQAVWASDLRNYHDRVTAQQQFGKLGLKDVDAVMVWAQAKGPELLKAGAGNRRDEEWVMAKVIERVLRRHPGQWGALQALAKVDGPADAAGFEQWRALVNPGQQPLVADLAAALGAPIGAAGSEPLADEK